MRAQGRYQDSKGDFYAAGITYFTIFALFPLLMVGFAIGGFVLANRPDLLAEIQEQIKSTISGDVGQQLVELMESAIDSRTSVGIIGLVTAAWAGLGWMANLREALSQMWGLMRQETKGFVGTKLSDLTAMVGLFRRADPHHRADRAGQCRRDETGAGMAWAAGGSRRRCGAAGCVAGGLGAHHRGCCSPG